MSSGAFRKKKISFAQVSNIALRDKDLSLKAKGLLALIESYLTLDNFTLYKQFLINKSTDGEISFRSAWKELKDKGYLIQYKLKNEDTKQFYYEYEICDNPDVENPHVANNHIEPHNELPHVENPLVAYLPNGLSTKWKTHLYNNSLSNNTLVINTIHTNIDYNPVFINSPDKETVDNIVDIVVDVLVNNYETVKINGGEINGEILKSMLLKLNMNHILYTVNAIKEYKGKIKNMRNFIITVLYNSILTLDSYYHNLINQ